MKRYKSILYCCADPTKNAGNLENYFIEESEKYTSFHFFPSYTTEYSYMEKYLNGKRVSRIEFSFYKGKGKIIKHVLGFLYFTYVLFFHLERGSYVITNAPFYLLFNLPYSFIKGFKYVFWIGDYYPSHKFPMNIYHFVVNAYNRHLNRVLYLSPPLEKIYSISRPKGIKEQISLGIDKKYLYKRTISDKLRVVFIGIIREQQGLDLFFSYLKKKDDIFLDVVGDGYSLNHYKNLSRKFGIDRKIKFHGKVNDPSGIFSKANIGIALYEEGSDNLSTYCEPTKIKDYLSYGLPVITTRTTYFAKELEKYFAGEVIDEDIKSLGDAILKIKKNYKTYLKGVDELVSYYQYKKWYDNKLSFLVNGK